MFTVIPAGMALLKNYHYKFNAIFVSYKYLLCLCIRSLSFICHKTDVASKKLDIWHIILITSYEMISTEHLLTNLRFLPSTLVMYLLDRRMYRRVSLRLRGLLELGFLWPFLSPTRWQRSGMRLRASVAFAFNSLAQGPVTRKCCRRRESNPGPRDSRPDASSTLPPRFATHFRTLVTSYEMISVCKLVTS